MPPNHYVTKEQHGWRLDKVLEQLFVSMSLRQRRALWKKGRVFVDNKARPAGYAVREGQCVQFVSDSTQAPEKQDIPTNTDLVLQAKYSSKPPPKHTWFFFHKPSQLATSAQYAQPKSLESLVSNILLEHNVDACPLLCNRLDTATSGIVVAAKDSDHVQIWRQWEQDGLCEKRYVAIVTSQNGHIPAQCTIKAELDTHKRKISRVLKTEAPVVRHTHFTHLGQLTKADLEALGQNFPHVFPEHAQQQAKTTHLVGAIIKQGARHQIRAHAAHAGFALLGDTRYALRQLPHEAEFFYLHHGFLRFPLGEVHCPPPWQNVLNDTLFSLIQKFFSCS